MRLDQFPDNHEVVYKVKLGTVRDITTPLTRLENVTKHQVRKMFQKFILASPELWQRSRVEQIDEFNSERRRVHHPAVKAEILADLEISFTETQ
jgi:hypothetical protein